MCCAKKNPGAYYIRYTTQGKEKTVQSAASRSALLTKYYSGDQIKNNEMGGACGTYGREERCIQGSGGES